MQVPASPYPDSSRNNPTLPLSSALEPSESLYVDRWKLYSFHLKASRDRDRARALRAFHAKQAAILRLKLPAAKVTGFDWKEFCRLSQSL
jgi:hypothetical protein